MNDRVMQFRIGMFVIVAGLALTMMIVWFEAPALIRERRYVTVFFNEAPGIDQGIPVRKSGVRVGEVFSYAFTEPDQPEGVLVTLSLDPTYTIRVGSMPRLGRALIGDVAIDFLPGTGSAPMTTYGEPTASAEPGRWVQGLVAADPFLLLNDASKIFERADATLVAIEAAAQSLATVVGKAETLDEFLMTWQSTGRSIEEVADEIDRVLRANEAEITPAIHSIRRVAEKMDTFLDPASREQVQQLLARLSSASTRLDAMLTEVQPVIAELKAGPTDKPRTNIGQALMRANRITYDISVLTAYLTDGKGHLNTRGTLQRLVADPQLYEDVRLLMRSANATVSEAGSVLRTFGVFADKISQNPSLISQGVLNPR